jgi:hypothetical protein
MKVGLIYPEFIMAQYVKFKTADGGFILVEASGTSPNTGTSKAGLGDKVQETVTHAQESFDGAMDVIGQSSSAFLAKIQSIAEPPESVEITFGLKVSAELGNFVVAKAGGEANFEVKLTWKRAEQAKNASKEGFLAAIPEK